MTNDSSNLILAIRDTIKDFTNGSLPFHDAKNEYQRLLEIYNKLERDKKRSEGASLINGLCYYHNIENFSLLSGVYYITSDDITSIKYYGDSKLDSKVIKALRSNIANINGNLLMVHSDENILLHNIYIYPMIIDKKGKTIFVAVSSSTYFSKEKFYFGGEFLKNLLSMRVEESKILALNYFEELSKEIDKYLKENIDDEYYIKAFLLVFNMVERIFNHMGIDSLIEASNKIIYILNNNFKENSRCFSLSIRDYIVLSKLKRNDDGDNIQNKLQFIYRDINMPYNSLEIKIETRDSIYNFWDKIFIFENYIVTGDIMK